MNEHDIKKMKINYFQIYQFFKILRIFSYLLKFIIEIFLYNNIKYPTYHKYIYIYI